MMEKPVFSFFFFFLSFSLYRRGGDLVRRSLQGFDGFRFVAHSFPFVSAHHVKMRCFRFKILPFILWLDWFTAVSGIVASRNLYLLFFRRGLFGIPGESGQYTAGAFNATQALTFVQVPARHLHCDVSCGGDIGVRGGVPFLQWPDQCSL